MKKIFILFILLALSLFTFNCGGGSGSSSSPKGENPGEPSIVQLLPAQFIAQTNSIITLHAKVLDGNGAPVKSEPVSFTNLSPIGTLNSTTAQTNNAGIATVTLKSTTSGFSTVQVEVNKGTGQVRDRKTVYFSSQSLTLLPFMELDVDGSDVEGSNKEEKFNEPEDFTLFESETDNQVNIRATVYDRFGERAPFIGVTFGADSSEATFPLGKIGTTDANGEAFVLVEVKPTAIRNLETVLNITSEADNGAVGMASLFLQPVIVSDVRVSANPTEVAPNGTSKITASVTLSTGNAAPDNTVVSFNPTCGSVTPFAQTTKGAAEATFTAPSTAGNCSVTASVGDVHASVSINVVGTLTILPGAQTVWSSCKSQEIQFSISGGLPPYNTTSSDPSKAFNDVTGTGLWSGSQISVTIPALVAAGAVTLTVYDSKGKTAPATITISGAPPLLSVDPPSVVPINICENTANCSSSNYPNNETFTITGGISPYTVTSDNTSVIADPGLLSDNTFIVNPKDNSINANTLVILTVTDSCNATKPVNILVIN